MKKILFLLISLTLWQLTAVAQVRTITGKVTSSEDGQPLPGVTILNKTAGVGVGVASDVNGRYSIQAKTGDKLFFSFVGMKTEVVTVGALNVLDVKIKPEAEQIDEVVVIAYGGPRKKGTVTGAVSAVRGEVLDAKPVASFDQALQGQVAGVQITTSSGEPTAASSVRIRGISSIAAATAPLYIMDGVAITEGDFSTLNMNDIENISVLKDASSTSIYGSRAANGVIVITTKRGKYGQDARINFRAMYGVTNLLSGDFDMMNTAEILELEEELGLRFPEESTTKDLAKVNTNWMDEMFHQGKIQNYELSVNGGTERLQYYISGSYYGQDGIAPRSGLQRFVFRSNLEGRMKQWLKVGANVSLGYSTYERTEGGGKTFNPAVAAIVTKPYYNPYKADGSFQENWDAVSNPLYQIAKHPSESEDLKLVGSFFAELNPVEGLYIKSLGGIDGMLSRGSARSLPSYAENEKAGGNAVESYGRLFRFTLTNTINYQTTINDRHSLIALLGQEAIYGEANSFAAMNKGTRDDRLSSLSSGSVATLASGGNVEGYGYLSWFGRLEYNLDSKYFIDLSLRSDGSSRFAEGQRWSTFWSVGLMWNLKQEAFLENSDWLSDARLSFSAGTSGNSEIGNYKYMSWVANGSTYNQLNGMYPVSSAGNRDITWEEIFSTNVGAEVMLWDRLDLKVDWYQKTTSNMLLDVPLSLMTGYSRMTQNIGEMSNRGLEVEAGGDVIRNLGGFKWNLRGNFAWNQNKLEKLYDGADEFLSSGTGQIYQVGESLGSFFMPRFAGVNPANGDALWYDKNGNVTNIYSEDNAVLLGKSFYAPWNGGFTTTFSYKGLSLSAFFNWVAGRYVMNNNRFFIENTGIDYVQQWNMSKKMLNRWRKPGDVTDIPRADQITQVNSDQWIDDASFLRLKNVTLSYNLPASWLKHTKVISSARIYAQGQNLITWTKFEGFDPEDDTNVTFGRYPTSRQFTFGLDVSF